MSQRLPIPAARIAEVATAARVCESTVHRYRDGWGVLRVTQDAIERAVRALPPEPQLELQAGHHPPREPVVLDVAAPVVVGSSPAGSPGRGSHSSAAEQPERRHRLEPPVRRCRVTILDERGEVVTP